MVKISKNLRFEFQRFSMVSGLVVFHVGALFVFLTGVSWTAVTIGLVLFVVRTLGGLVGYHRFFSHQSFEAKRWVQFALAFCGMLGANGPVRRWVAHHYLHHQYSDVEGDVHSPAHGHFHSYMGWYLDRSFYEVPVPEFVEKRITPEIKWLDGFFELILLAQIPALYFLGSFLEVRFPELQTDGAMLVVVGFFLSLVLSMQGIFMVNLICHIPRFGTRDFETKDRSRNNWFVAILTLGEGWHNGHHRFPNSARHGLLPGQWDPNFWFIKLLERLGLAWNVKDAREVAVRSTRKG